MSDPERLLRLVVPTPAFVGDDGVPSWRAFRPSPEDYARKPVRVTVWDLALVTVKQAEAFLPPKPRRPFELHASDVAAAREHWKLPDVRLVREPIVEAPQAALPGADAHCGIEGLGMRADENEKQHGVRLSFLASRLRPL